jgi:ribosomal protein S18 acetylase RimI-like enzyme
MRPMESQLTLRPLGDDEYDAWYAFVRDEFAKSLIELGDTPVDAAHARAEKVMEDVLPEGLATPGQAVSVVERGGEPVGKLWLAEREMDGRQVLYIYDVEVEEAYRGQGLGRATMLLAEDEARARGLSRIELNVFGGNAVARRLYLSLGYAERSISMGKDLA